MFRSLYSVSVSCSVYCLCVNVYCTTATGISGHFSTTITEVFPYFFHSCNQMPGYNSQGRGTARTFQFFLFIVVHVPFSVFCVLFVCKCALYCCHRVSTKCALYCCHRVSTKCALYCCHRVSTQLQLEINIIINITMLLYSLAKKLSQSVINMFNSQVLLSVRRRCITKNPSAYIKIWRLRLSIKTQSIIRI
jgi:hypothetical protein